MPRHRGKYNPGNDAPFELSRFWIEQFIKCPQCFWLTKFHGVKQPSMPSFLLNSLTDMMLKREMDAYRRSQKPHPWFVEQGLSHLQPLDHEDLQEWTDALQFGASPRKYNTVHKATNILFGGGIDDMFLNTDTGQFHVVDYKSTAVSKFERRDEVNLDGFYKQGYKRQMDMYAWIGKQKGLPISDIAYFLYVDGQSCDGTGKPYDGMFLDQGSPQLKFQPTLIPYEANDSWVESTLFDIKELLESESQPQHSEGCEFGAYLDQVAYATSATAFFRG